MTEPRPIVRQSQDADIQRLLRSAALDVPAPGGRHRTLIALGLGGSLAATAQVAGVSSAAAATAGTTAAAGSVPAAGLATALGKWLAIGAVASALASGTAAVVHSVGEKSSPTTAPAEVRSPLSPAAARLAQGPRIVPPYTELTLTAGPERQTNQPPSHAAFLPDDAAALGRGVDSSTTPHPTGAGLPQTKQRSASASAHAFAPTRPAKTSASEPTLLAEIAELDRAQRALAAGSPAKALASLDDHQRKFISPRLGSEAMVLRIRALLALNRPAEARRLAEQALTGQPNSAFAQRLRSLLGQMDAR